MPQKYLIRTIWRRYVFEELKNGWDDDGEWYDYEPTPGEYLPGTQGYIGVVESLSQSDLTSSLFYEGDPLKVVITLA